MRINLTRKAAQIVYQELESSRFRSGEEVIVEALRALREKQRSGVAMNDAQRRDAVREMLLFVEKNHTRLRDVSVKNLIHESHRL